MLSQYLELVLICSFRIPVTDFYLSALLESKVLEKFGPSQSQIAVKFFYKALRATLPKVNGEIDMDGEIESIFINPNEFLLFIEGHFNSFLNDLRNEANQELRDNFIKACELKWRLQDGPIVISDQSVNQERR